jgi:acylphosphatase
VVDDLARWRIVAAGTVRLVDYRERVQRAALAHHIVGDVENDRKDDERVIIDAQGLPSDLLDFLESIRGPEGRSDGREVLKTKDLEPDLRLTRFQIRRGRPKEETLERVEFARHALTGLMSEVESLRGELKEKWAGLEVDIKEISEALSATGAAVEEQVGATKQALKELGEDLQSQVIALDKKISGALTATGAAVEEQEGTTKQALTTLGEDLQSEVVALDKKIKGQGEASAKFERDVTVRLEHLDSACALIAKSLVRIEKILEQEAEEQEHQARSTEQQRAALLHLADQLARPSSYPRRRGRAVR